MKNAKIIYKRNFFGAIYSAIKISSDKGDDVKTILGEELIITLDQLHLEFYVSDRKSFNSSCHLRNGSIITTNNMYKEMIDILGFDLIEMEGKTID